MFTEEQKRTADISSLQDFQLNTKDDWASWEFEDSEYEGLPLGFNNKYNLHRNIKFCDLSQLQQTQEDAEFLIVE